MRRPQQPQQVYELLPVDVVPRQTQIQVFLFVWAIRPQNVQPLPATTHPRQKTLPHQQPARIDQFQPPQRMTSIHELPPLPPRPRPPPSPLLPPVVATQLY